MPSAAPTPTPTPTSAAPLVPVSACLNEDHGVAGGYVVNADPWNTGGRLCITSSGGPDFTVTETTVDPSNVGGGGTLGAYPHIGTLDGGSHGLPLPAGRVPGSTVTWKTDHFTDGGFNTSLDLWFNPNCDPGAHGAVYTDPASVEIMVWLNHQNVTTPSSAGDWSGRLFHFPDVVLGGQPYRVSVETRPGPKYVVYYERVNQVDSVDGLQIGDFTLDAMSRRVPGREPIIPSDSRLCAVQAGFEITHGSRGIRTNWFEFRAP
ncbi:MAG: hypothetical protein ABIS86_09070 [Streptosporangiaceae bacterium]